MKYLFFFLFLTTNAFSEVRTDTQSWSNFNVTKALSTKWLLYGEFQPRIVDHMKKHGTSLYRFAIGRNLPHSFSLWVGYNFIERTSPSYLHEDRPFLQLLHVNNFDETLKLINRTRFELQYYRHQRDGAYRFRHMVRLQKRLGSSPWGVVASNEWFWFSATHKPSNSREGFDQNRAFAGVFYLFGESLEHLVEIGYMNLYANRDPDLRLDILALQMALRY